MTVVPPQISFTPAWWLRSPHLQTVWGRLGRSRRLVAFRREWLDTPDGDVLAIDHLDAPDPAAPHLVMLHGLEGSSYSVYIQGLARLASASGWHVSVMNFRFCAREPDALNVCIPNRRPRLYHSGETSDFDHTVRALHARTPLRTFVAVGASLGGNVLLKWFGENRGQTIVRAAAALSVPFDLAAGARFLEIGLGRIYAGRFIQTLKAKLRYVHSHHAEAREKVDLAGALRARTFYEYDDAATAPLHGFAGAEDYWEKCSSIIFLGAIDIPVLVVNAVDDPFVPPDVVPRAIAAASPSVTIHATPAGGHVGFVTGDHPFRCRYWAEEEAMAFLARMIGDGE
ncbi:MAG: YheT family hydrolase [Thermoanaerobaculia bacterium]